MSDMVQGFRDMKELKKLLRQKFGQPCQHCQILRPKAHPKILLPQETCRAHKPHWQDPRPELTQEDYNQL